MGSYNRGKNLQGIRRHLDYGNITEKIFLIAPIEKFVLHNKFIRIGCFNI